jgi:hypothetical protein
VSLADDAKAILAADVALMMILTGGIHTGMEITRQGMPAAFDANSEILPCALVKTEVETPWGPFDGSSRVYVIIFLYERAGNSNIEAALNRIYTLLHRQKLATTYNTWETHHANDILEQEDQALSCAMATSRFVLHRDREG